MKFCLFTFYSLIYVYFNKLYYLKIIYFVYVLKFVFLESNKFISYDPLNCLGIWVIYACIFSPLFFEKHD